MKSEDAAGIALVISIASATVALTLAQLEERGKTRLPGVWSSGDENHRTWAGSDTAQALRLRVREAI